MATQMSGRYTIEPMKSAYADLSFRLVANRQDRATMTTPSTNATQK
jgi:hypothetical protein